MLVLTRKVGQSVWIGDNVKLTINRLDCGDVVLGFDAPLEVPIDREEIRVEKERRREQSANNAQ